MLYHAVLAAGLVLLFAACLYDWALRLVPNVIPLGLAASGITLRLLTATLPSGLFAGLAVFVLAALCWRRGWLGGADVKLLGAGAMLVAPQAVFGFVLATCLAGGCLALLYLLAGVMTPLPGPKPAGAGLLRRLVRLEQRRLLRRGPLPYATAIAAGACFVLVRR